MHPQSIFTFKTTLLRCIIIITFASHTLSLDPKFEACAPRTCGNDLIISYPFWISDEQEPFCGHPNFGITCNHENHTVLTISHDDYIIKDIFYGNTSFTVANSLVYQESCPSPLRNLTLDRTPFNFSTNTDLFIWYNCTENPPQYVTYPINCFSNATLHSFAGFHKDVLVDANYSLESCQSFVYAPVHLENGVDLASLRSMNYTEILKMGFLLNWTAHSCSNCEESGGRCGFSNNEFVCFCQDRPHLKTCDDGDDKNWRLKVGIGNTTIQVLHLIAEPSNLAVLPETSGLGAGMMGIIIACAIICIFRWKKISSVLLTVCCRKVTKSDRDLEAFIRNYGPLAPKRYSFPNVKKMTNSFRDKLGQGGYGSVYKGKLSDGRLVAVKLLNASKGNGQEFINEVASISRTSHVNVVTLLGFCLEGSKRALIYEFMPNGSLEKFVYNGDTSKPSDQHLGWDKMYEIVTGIAKGLEYLHRGCNTRILHFDIKPQNILLDENFCPKISDFGLAKLCLKKESIVSMSEARGTIGYIAPEVFSRNFGEVSHKSDVYSYGMMIMELVGCKHKLDSGIDHSSEIYFPHWIYKHIEQGKELKLPGVVTSEKSEIVRKMIIVALWCIQTRPSERPSMNRVIEMLQEDALQTPSMPFLSSPPRPSITYSSTISTS